MKNWVYGVVVAMALVLVLTFPVSVPAAPPAKSPQPGAASPVPDHPEIREAIESLRRAREHMSHAAHDFGGHREDALRATDDAIRQLEICLKFDR